MKLYGQSPNRLCFCFAWDKVGFSHRNQLFPRKRLVLLPKTTFCQDKLDFRFKTISSSKNMLFSAQSQLYPRKKQTWFASLAVEFPTRSFCSLGFSIEKVCFQVQNHLCPRKKVVLRPETNLLLRKSVYFTPKAKLLQAESVYFICCLCALRN